MYHRHPATDIIKYTRRGMIRSAILRVLGLPEWMLDGNCFGEHDSELVYDSIVVRIVNLRHRLSTLHKDRMGQQLTPVFISMAEKLHGEARDLDNALQDWAGHQLCIWARQRHILSGPHIFPTKDFYSSEVYNYSSPVYASAWILYYATRLLINSTLLKIIRVIGPQSNSIAFQRRFEYLSVMTSTANDLALSIPCALQRFTLTDTSDGSSGQNSIVINENEEVKPYVANLIIWPLSLSANMSGVDDRYKSWFRSLLACLGRITGIALLENAETDSWPEL